jgi:hypothetical protein
VQPQTLGDGQRELRMGDESTGFFGHMDGRQEGASGARTDTCSSASGEGHDHPLAAKCSS